MDTLCVSNAVVALHSLQERSPGALLFILCDPVLFDPAELLEVEKRALPKKVLRCPELTADLMPYLLPVSRDFAGEFLLQESVELAIQEVRHASKNLPASRSVAAWLFVKPDRVGRLVSCMTRRSMLHTSVQSANEKLFRYWDPRVFGHLPRIMGESFFSWLGEEVCWCWMDAAGNVRQVDLVASDSPSASQDDKFLASLRRIAEINQCLVFTEKTSAEKEAQTESHFDRLLIHAERIGCQTSVDRMTYAVLADGLGQGFETNEQLSSSMAPFFEGKAAFSACAANISQDVWDQVRENHLTLS